LRPMVRILMVMVRREFHCFPATDRVAAQWLFSRIATSFFNCAESRCLTI
jgi:hypothetical protein